MKRTKLMNRPVRVTDMYYDDDYEGYERQLDKVQRSQIKKWRKLKQQLI